MAVRLPPGLQYLGRVAVDVEPRQRVRERRTMGQAARRTRRNLRRHEAWREIDNLPEPLDVAARDRQHAEAHPIRVRLTRSAVSHAGREHAERLQQRSDEHGVREIGWR